MKQYLLFIYDIEAPSGGFNDFVKDFDDMSSLVQFIKTEGFYYRNEFQAVDIVNGRKTEVCDYKETISWLDYNSLYILID